MDCKKFWIIAVTTLILSFIIYTCSSQTYCQPAHDETLQRIKIIQLDRKVNIANKYIDQSKINFQLYCETDSLLSLCNNNVAKITEDFSRHLEYLNGSLDSISKVNLSIKESYKKDKNDWNNKEIQFNKKIKVYKKKVIIYSCIAFFLGETIALMFR